MKRGKWAALLCALAVSAAGAGCGRKALVPQISTKTVLKVDGETYTVPQAKVYLLNYQNLYGTVAGADMWQYGNQDGELEDYVKNLTISQMTKILSMDSLAKSRNIVLDESELASTKKAAAVYYESLNEQELNWLGVDETDIQKLYEDYALAQKLYISLTADINSEVSDDEARIMDAMQIVVADKKTASEVKKALAQGGDFATLANSYNEAGEVTIQFGRGELPEKVEKAAFALDNGTTSEYIKTKNGYHFIHCVNKFNEELTDANKRKIVQKREKAAFGDVYDAYIKTITKKMYQNVWDDITIEHSSETVSDSFFAVWRAYCGESS